jgi:hypothetical protein
MYINVKTLETTYKIVIKNVSLPMVVDDNVLKEIGYARVVYAPTPEHAAGRVVKLGLVEKIKGVYVQQWDVNDNELDAIVDIRLERDSRLRSCDYTQAEDSTEDVPNKAAWKTYRQELRDLPAIYEDNPEDVVWPTLKVS